MKKSRWNYVGSSHMRIIPQNYM